MPRTPVASSRTGSNDLVVGYNNGWTSFGQLVGGATNSATSPFATVFGVANSASGVGSLVAGDANHATGTESSVLGGRATPPAEVGARFSGDPPAMPQAPANRSRPRTPADQGAAGQVAPRQLLRSAQPSDQPPDHAVLIVGARDGCGSGEDGRMGAGWGNRLIGNGKHAQIVEAIPADQHRRSA